jgi:hypothetical protein
VIRAGKGREFDRFASAKREFVFAQGPRMVLRQKNRGDWVARCGPGPGRIAGWMPVVWKPAVAAAVSLEGNDAAAPHGRAPPFRVVHIDDAHGTIRLCNG